jgi:hypothetical protein
LPKSFALELNPDYKSQVYKSQFAQSKPLQTTLIINNVYKPAALKPQNDNVKSKAPTPEEISQEID